MSATGPAAAPPPHAAPGAPAPVAPPPPGPGVTPPFAAPPVEGRSRRLWFGLGIGAVVLTLCGGAGLAAIIGLAVTGTEALNEQAQAVTGAYYTALAEQEYEQAYDLLCDQLQAGQSRAEYVRTAGLGPRIDSYQVGKTVIGNELTVPVDVVFDGGGTERQNVTLAQDTSTGEFEVCGVS